MMPIIPASSKVPPELAGREQSLVEEPLVFLESMQAGKPRQGALERSPADQRRRVHIGKVELSQHLDGILAPTAEIGFPLNLVCPGGRRAGIVADLPRPRVFSMP
jgi:hypothetical protein